MGITRPNFSASGISFVFTIIFNILVSQSVILHPLLVGAQPPKHQELVPFFSLNAL